MIILENLLAKGERKEALCDFYYPHETPINAFDISVILHNALDNAIEGAAHC